MKNCIISFFQDGGHPRIYAKTIINNLKVTAIRVDQNFFIQFFIQFNIGKGKVRVRGTNRRGISSMADFVRPSSCRCFPILLRLFRSSLMRIQSSTTNISDPEYSEGKIWKKYTLFEPSSRMEKKRCWKSKRKKCDGIWKGRSQHSSTIYCLFKSKFSYTRWAGNFTIIPFRIILVSQSFFSLPFLPAYYCYYCYCNSTVGGSYPRSARWDENIVRVKHVLPQLAVLGVSGRAQVTGEVFLATALEPQMLDQIVPQLVGSAALVARESFRVCPWIVSRCPMCDSRCRFWKTTRTKCQKCGSSGRSRRVETTSFG